MRKKNLILTSVLMLLLALPAMAGDKMNRLYQNALMIRDATVLVVPIFEDPFYIKKLEEKGKTEKVEEYKEKVKQANKNLFKAIDYYYDFSEYILMDTVPEMWDSEKWIGHMKKFDPKKYFVLQFGLNMQVAGEPEKISSEHTNVFGVYETDGKSDLFLYAGKLTNAHKSSYMDALVQNFNRWIRKMAVKGEAKGFSAPKSKKR